jgi:hypothetical protein
MYVRIGYGISGKQDAWHYHPCGLLYGTWLDLFIRSFSWSAACVSRAPASVFSSLVAFGSVNVRAARLAMCSLVISAFFGAFAMGTVGVINGLRNLTSTFDGFRPHPQVISSPFQTLPSSNAIATWQEIIRQGNSHSLSGQGKNN